jgi:hypothetical protein
MHRNRQHPRLLFDELPPLSDEAACALHAFLAELLTEFESAYFGQIKRFAHAQRTERDDLHDDHPTAPDSDPPF